MNTDTTASTPVPSTQSRPGATAPTIAVVVTHKVRDYDTWKQAFDGHADARRQAGVIAHHINRAVDDPNLLAVYLAGTDTAKLQAFLSSEELKSTMASAGVTGPPTITLVQPVVDRTEKRDPLFGMIVVHPVADFDAWRKVYDEVEPLRREGGIIGHAVNRSVDDPNLVVVFHQAESLEALHAFAESDALKGAMQRAGVSAPPKFMFYRGAGWGAN